MELKKIRRKVYIFLLFGIIGFIFILLSYKSLIPFSDIISVIASFITSFSIWECSELLIFEEDDLKEQIIKYNHLSRIRVVFNKEDS